MSDQKPNAFQYESINANRDPNAIQSPHPSDYPITPPPYTPYPDQNSYMPNPSNAGINSEPHPIYSQPMPAFPPISNTSDMYRTNYGTIVQTMPQTVIFIGSCPACRVGILEEDFTCLGILLALVLFPLGILCCLALRQRRCPNCGATFE